MTTNQTIDGVPRELLAQWLAMFEGGIASSPLSALRELTRKYLQTEPAAQPACKACNDTGKMHEPGQEPGACTACLEKPDAQPQVEPVATVRSVVSRKSSVFDIVVHDNQALHPGTKLYAEQPAPVAVVLPEQLITAIETEQARLSKEDYLMDSEDCVKVIREEVTRLNGAKP